MNQGLAAAGVGSIRDRGIAMMAICCRPNLSAHGLPAWRAPTLPAAGLPYTLMTIDSGVCHEFGRGGAWKGRRYGGPPTGPRR